jgi:hypothetical protein
MFAKFLNTIRALLCKSDGTISATKVLALLTAALGTLIALPGVFAAAGLAVPAVVLPYIKLATVISATLTAFRLKWNVGQAAEGNTNVK